MSARRSPVRVAIGVHVFADAAGLHATLDALARDMGPACQTARQAAREIVLLPDGPEPDVVEALARHAHLPALASAERCGGAAAFNRLAGRDADVIVLLESGAIPGPGWLERLLDALAADPRHGLAGPATNRAWNEQAMFPGTAATAQDIARAAQQAAQQHGDAYRALRPLHSLSDFCYAVRRDVIEAVGLADEEYGAGSCWEMDYNLRAARAGYDGVWVPSAYVHRLPVTAAARQQAERGHEAGKRRYQDKLCLLRRLEPERPYQDHCKGEECPYFAPLSLVQPHLRAPAAAAGAPSGLPLVSCVMVTRGRAAFVQQSISYFQAQDYPHRELVIVYEDGTDLPDPMPDDARVRSKRVGPGLSLGAKRNIGVAEARGDIIAQWDDDDWYAPARLRRQAAPILAGAADITGLRAHRFFDLDAWKHWTCSPALHARMFIEGVAGGTLVYRRALWGRPAHYPDTNLREDADFLVAAMRAGARLERLSTGDLFVYVRHGANTWRFASGSFLMPAGWRELGEPDWPAETRAFYRAQARIRRAQPAPGRSPRSGKGMPRVACIMPTSDRLEMVPRAIRHFLRQRYEHRQLLVIDDGSRPVGHLVPADDRVRYIRLDTRMTLGSKRNLACEEADADLIIHWDDDDWMAPGWIDAQVRALLDSDADVAGLSQVYFYAPVERRAWRYVYPAHARPWVHGATLCYTRAFWQRNPFPPITVGEDLRFLWNGGAHRIVAHEHSDLFVAYVHPGNTSPKRFISTRWRACPVEVVDRLMLAHGRPAAEPEVRAS